MFEQNNGLDKCKELKNVFTFLNNWHNF